MFGEERSWNVWGGVSSPPLGWDETSRAEILAWRQHWDYLILTHAPLPPTTHSDPQDQQDGEDDGQHHRDHQHVQPLLGEHGHHLSLDLAVGADEDLVVGGELGLVELPRELDRLGDGGDREVVGGEVVKIGQLGLKNISSQSYSVSHNVCW